MKYSLQLRKNKNLFKRYKYLCQNSLMIKYFWILSYNHWGEGGGGGGWISLKYPILNFKKTVYLKNIWM